MIAFLQGGPGQMEWGRASPSLLTAQQDKSGHFLGAAHFLVTMSCASPESWLPRCLTPSPGEVGKAGKKDNPTLLHSCLQAAGQGGRSRPLMGALGGGRIEASEDLFTLHFLVLSATMLALPPTGES